MPKPWLVLSSSEAKPKALSDQVQGSALLLIVHSSCMIQVLGFQSFLAQPPITAHMLTLGRNQQAIQAPNTAARYKENPLQHRRSLKCALHLANYLSATARPCVEAKLSTYPVEMYLGIPAIQPL